MKILVIPDIHLKAWIFDRAEDILKSGKADMAVCLMDIADDWGKELEISLYEKTFKRAIKFARMYPDTLWCYGNHDVSYLWKKLETGYSIYAENTVISKLNKLENSLRNPSQIAFIHRIDNILFSHGGLITNFILRLNSDLFNAPIDKVIETVNNAPKDYLWDNRSPLWARPQYSEVLIFRKDIYIQVVGHTPVKKIFKKNGVISTDVFSTYNNEQQIGESAMIIIDSISGNFDKIKI